jgi:mersacidin/lichenicidin family type 2 lantibiotic
LAARGGRKESSVMEEIDWIRAWKDPVYRATLSTDQLSALPAHPAGAVELSDDQLKAVGGGRILTTVETCTAPTFRNWKACGC